MPSRFSPVAITGASGFVGNCALRRLLSEGHEVHALVRPDARRWRFQGILDQVRIHEADVLDPEAVGAAFRTIRPVVVMHFAAFGAYEWQSDPRRILLTNVLGTLNVLEASISAGASVFVNAGTSSEYGLKDGPMREDDRLAPNSLYAVSKAAQTHLCGVLAKERAMPAVTFRLFSVYGPWEEPARLLPTLIRRARAGLPLEMAHPDLAHDFVYVEDVLDALLDFERVSRFPGEVFNLGSGRQSTLKDVVAVLQETLGVRSEVRWGARPARKWDTTSWRSDPSKANSLLGWVPRHGLQEGIRAMAEWMASIGDSYGPA